MRRRAGGLLAALVLCACSRQGDKPAAADATPAAAPGTAAGSAKVKGKKPTAPTAKPGKPVGAAPAALDAGAVDPTKIVEVEELKAEERESNPFSETVTLKLSVTPAVKATVNWGAKVLARLEPGKMDTEITRPRGSGPLDLEIKAEGYLPYHTRLHTGRNDRLSVRLARPEDAPNLFGYKRSPEGRKAEAEKAEKQK
jgi:hypothetical protein